MEMIFDSSEHCVRHAWVTDDFRSVAAGASHCVDIQLKDCRNVIDDVDVQTILFFFSS